MNDIDFIVPQKLEIHKIPVIMDYLSVEAHKLEKVLDFARYMGYGIDGFKNE